MPRSPSHQQCCQSLNSFILAATWLTSVSPALQQHSLACPLSFPGTIMTLCELLRRREWTSGGGWEGKAFSHTHAHILRHTRARVMIHACGSCRQVVVVHPINQPLPPSLPLSVRALPHLQRRLGLLPRLPAAQCSVPGVQGLGGDGVT